MSNYQDELNCYKNKVMCYQDEANRYQRRLMSDEKPTTGTKIREAQRRFETEATRQQHVIMAEYRAVREKIGRRLLFQYRWRQRHYRRAVIQWLLVLTTLAIVVCVAWVALP